MKLNIIHTLKLEENEQEEPLSIIHYNCTAIWPFVPVARAVLVPSASGDSEGLSVYCTLAYKENAIVFSSHTT